MESIWPFLTPKRHFRLFALCKYDLIHLNGNNISSFSDRSITKFQAGQNCLKKLKDRVLFKNLSFRDRVSFSGI